MASSEPSRAELLTLCRARLDEIESMTKGALGAEVWRLAAAQGFRPTTERVQIQVDSQFQAGSLSDLLDALRSALLFAEQLPEPWTSRELVAAIADDLLPLGIAE